MAGMELREVTCSRFTEAFLKKMFRGLPAFKYKNVFLTLILRLGLFL